jgi:hypothetical protein
MTSSNDTETLSIFTSLNDNFFRDDKNYRSFVLFWKQNLYVEQLIHH